MGKIDARTKATQAAMAAEMRSWLGRANRSQAWMGREIGLSQSAWRHYFTAFDRDIPMSVVRQIADVMGIAAGELLLKAEADAPEFLGQFLDVSAEERADLDQAVRRHQPTRASKVSKRGTSTQRRVSGE